MGGVHLQGVRVLVAEDNLINQMVAKKMLAALGATVSVVSNGQEAVNIVCATQCRQSEDTNYDASQTDSSRDTGSENECAFDVVLMDMAMPQMDGLQVCCHYTPSALELQCSSAPRVHVLGTEFSKLVVTHRTLVYPLMFSQLFADAYIASVPRSPARQFSATAAVFVHTNLVT